MLLITAYGVMFCYTATSLPKTTSGWKSGFSVLLNLGWFLF